MFIFTIHIAVWMLNEIAKDHLKWVEVVKIFGINDYPEDIVQEMYLRISKSKIISSRNYKGYVYLTLRNLCYDYHNSKKWDYEIKDNLTPDNNTSDARLLWLDIQRALHELPLFERQVIQLHNIEKISLREIERETGVCKMKMSRAKYTALEKLKRKIG